MIKVKLIRYDLNMDEEKDRKEYKKIQDRCKKLGYKLFNYIAMGEKNEIPEGEYEIDTSCLFDTQYNTIKTKEHRGYRIHDWLEPIYPNRRLKKGYYLENTEELKKLLSVTYECKYCGKQYTQEEATKVKYCKKCRGSDYLKEENYNLIILTKIGNKASKGKLPDEVIKDIKEQQKETFKQQIFKSNKDKLYSLQQDIEEAKVEYQGYLWLVEHYISIENVIYYSYKKTFCFGWKEPIKNRKELEKQLKDFKWKFEIK